MQEIKNESATNATDSSIKQNNYNKNEPKSPAELFPDLEPWPEPVDGVELANEIKSMFDRYLYLPNGASAAVTMWVLHTYGVDCFDISPRLYISSPMPGCGKTTLMDLVELLSYRSLGVSNITAAAMFRIISECHPTLLIDEADTFLKANEELRGIINAGYEQGGKVSRVEVINKKQVVSIFPCYAACAIAGIGGTHKTIQERSVNIVMKRKTHADKIERMRKREIRKITPDIQRKCLRWAADHAEQISRTRPEMPLYMGDRTADIWEPLFAIAETLSPEWLSQINTAAKALGKSQPNDDETSLRFQLLADIKGIFDEHPGQKEFGSSWLVEELRRLEESPWAEYGFGRGLSVHSLAKQLKFFNILPHQVRHSYERHRCFARADFVDAFSRYLPEAQTEPAHAEPGTPPARHNGTTEKAKAEFMEKLRKEGTDQESLKWLEENEWLEIKETGDNEPL